MSPATPSPLTQLSEEENLFYSTVRAFAQEKIEPLVRSMDSDQQLDPGLLQQLFELGLLGIETSEAFGGAGGSFFDAVLAIEAISTVDPGVAVLIDVHNTLVINALLLIFLTVLLLELIESNTTTLNSHALLLLVQQFGIGAVAGVGGGAALSWLFFVVAAVAWWRKLVRDSFAPK